MLKDLFILLNGNGAGYNTSKPKTLYKNEPITITLTPGIVIAGVILLFLLFVICFGSIENYNFLLSGV